jgi:hypothetical protein
MKMEDAMKSVLLRYAIAIAVTLTAEGWVATSTAARADQVLRSVRSDAALAANWRRFRRWSFYGGPYVGPYWGGGYYSPYASPPLYYNRIAPGVYYYY